MRYAHCMYGMGGMGLWMTIWMLAGIGVIIAVVLGIIWLVRTSSPRLGNPTAQPDEALQVLRRRYAAGDIDQEQYQNQLRDLQIR